MILNHDQQWGERSDRPDVLAWQVLQVQGLQQQGIDVMLNPRKALFSAADPPIRPIVSGLIRFQIKLELEGARAIAPMEATGSFSKIGFQDRPPSMVLKTPPAAAPT